VNSVSKETYVYPNKRTANTKRDVFLVAHCNTLQHTATHRRSYMPHILQHTATQCNTLQHTATHCNTLQCTATHRRGCTPHTMQHTATHSNALQHTATHCNTLQHIKDAAHRLHCNASERLITSQDSRVRSCACICAYMRVCECVYLQQSTFVQVAVML